jgi:hypothetical protein
LGVETPRLLVLNVGDNYRQDYIVPHTVVAVDLKTGELQRSNGGYLNDDTPLLTAAAQTAFEWYSQTRNVLTYAMRHLPNLRIGDFVLQLGDPAEAAAHPTTIYEVNTPITEIKLMIGRGTAESPPEVPTMLLTTGAGELDPFRTLAPPRERN